MAAAVSRDEIAARTGRMQRMTPAERGAAIDSAQNVIGYNRFLDHAGQASLSQSYRHAFRGQRP